MFTYELLNLNNKEHLKVIKAILLDPDDNHEWKDTFYYFQLSYQRYLKEKQEKKIEDEWILKDKEHYIGWFRKVTMDTGSQFVTDLDYVIIPSQRKKGYATKLLEEQEKMLFEKNNIGEIDLVVGKNNLPNRTLLEKMGYSSIKRNPLQPCIRYFKKNPLLEEKQKGK